VREIEKKQALGADLDDVVVGFETSEYTYVGILLDSPA